MENTLEELVQKNSMGEREEIRKTAKEILKILDGLSYGNANKALKVAADTYEEYVYLQLQKTKITLKTNTNN